MLYFTIVLIFEYTILYVTAQAADPINYEHMEEPEPTLKFAIAIYRHGNRSPLYFPYKNDPYKPKSKYFPEGKGQLTKAGKQLMYNVGRALRARYGSFIGDDGIFNGRKTRFTSTPEIRNKLSALLVTEGFFSKGMDLPDFSKKEEYLNRKHIPVGYNTNDFDKTFLVSKFPQQATDCMYFSKQFFLNVISGLILPPTKENKELIKYLSKHTGNRFKSVVSFLNIWDNLECERLNGLKLPDWSKGVYPEKMLPLALDHIKMTIGGTELMTTLVTAPFFKELHRLFLKAKNEIENDKLEEKMYLHATHENGIYQLFFKLGIKNPDKVEVGDTIIFELHKIDEEYFIKTYYYVPYDDKFSTIVIPGCEMNCPLKKFCDLTPEMSVEKYKMLCKTQTTSFLNFKKSMKYLFQFFGELLKWLLGSKSI